jgi:outer membrane immunogenic protein
MMTIISLTPGSTSVKSMIYLQSLGANMKSILVAAMTSVSLLAIAPATVMAADLIIEEPIYTPGVVDVGGNWEGVYIGGFVGGASGTFDAEADDTWFDFDDSIGVSGWLLGVNVGANFYLTEGIVAGVVGDIAWSNASGDVYDGFSSYDINWSGSLRGRLGYDGGAIMPYVTGGLAFANGTFSFGGLSSSDSQTHIGWTVGAGVEVAVTEDLSIDALYRYSDYGSRTYYSTAPDLSLTSHQVTVGLNWKF